MSRILSRNLIAGCACLLVSAAASVAEAQSQRCVSAHAATGKIVVTVSGLASDKGLVNFGLYNSEATFPKKGAAYRRGGANILGRRSTWTMDTIPYGEYAVAVYHDENENGEHDMFLIFPLEDYGVSGYEKPPLETPKWETAKFCLNSDRINISVPVK